ncbi:tryptophan synthase subunit alpha [Clostridium algidicarnis]|uniref:tryptophan synthase subunit alpha n=1 Tax=Clostridium algidicarnis TaxID=37659 RepID=UPI001C0BFBB0|nr:tryptophan synthase subunit alpha [Clostridium algidicarnis]MBU3209307.1 tryptophan synthase subunit alpha [Clostridium algidicarnis]
MDRIWSNLKGKKALTVFLTAAYPNKERFFEIVDLISKASVDVLEIGIPVENPYVDGETIAKTHRQVLENSFDEKELKSILVSIREKYPNLLVVIMTYKVGIEKYNLLSMKDYYDALLCPEESLKFEDTNLINIYNEEMTLEEIEDRLRYNKGFAYVVSGVGKTGGTEKMPERYKHTMKIIRELSDIPVQIGFGVNTKEDAASVINNGADGVIIGSQFIRKVDTGSDTEILNFIKEINSSMK